MDKIVQKFKKKKKQKIKKQIKLFKNEQKLQINKLKKTKNVRH